MSTFRIACRAAAIGRPSHIDPCLVRCGCAPFLELLEPRLVLSSGPYFVTVTDDSTAAGTLRSAILAANQDTNPNPFDIEFAIPASTAPELNVPVPGFNPNTQTWTITLNSALPAITHAV